MKLPVAPLQRVAFGVAFCGLAAVGAGAIALATQPASSSAQPTTQQVEYVDPAADEAPVEATAPPADTSVAERAEDAASKAETAAGRAEVAAVKAETAVTSTTATTGGSGTTTTTGGGKPILVGVTVPTESDPTTTTTTTKPKTWVVVARVPYQRNKADAPPTTVDVELQTGQLRVSGFPGYRGILDAHQHAIWFGDTDADRLVPTGACPATAESTMIESSVKATPDCIWRGGWPAGNHTLVAGSYDGTAWIAPYGGSDTLTAQIVIEEYR